MGGCLSNQGNPSRAGTTVNSNQLVVATLNYCGIMHSPYEFYVDDHSNSLAAIGNIFEKTVEHYKVPGFEDRNPPETSKFKWLGGKLDHWFRPQRYSPMFDPQVGLNVKERRFQTRQQFEKHWDEVFDKNLNTVYKDAQKPFQPEEREALRLYDFIMYHTLLTWVYNQPDFETAIKNQVNDFVVKLKPLFDLSFLNDGRKLQKLADNYQKLRTDVFFFQEFSDKLKERLDNSGDYWLETDYPEQGKPDTLIMVKKKRFPDHQPKSLEQELQKVSQRLKSLPKTSFLFIDNFVFVGVHLSSSSEKNAKEVDLMLQQLIELKKAFPECHIVCGGDVNSYYGPDRNPHFKQEFRMFPVGEKDHTTIKQRTKTQAQWKKADVKVEESKDKIMSDLKFKSGKIALINNDETRSRNTLPSDDHPFDHFAVVTTLDTSK